MRVGLLQDALDRVAQQFPVGRALRVAGDLLQAGQRPAGLDRVGTPAERVVERLAQPREPGRLEQGPDQFAGGQLGLGDELGDGEADPVQVEQAQQPLPRLPGHAALAGGEQVDRGEQDGPLALGEGGELAQRLAVGGGEPAGLGGLGQEPDDRDDVGDHPAQHLGLVGGQRRDDRPRVGAAAGELVDLVEQAEGVDRVAGQPGGDRPEGLEGLHVVLAHGLGEDVDDRLGAGEGAGGVGVEVVVDRRLGGAAGCLVAEQEPAGLVADGGVGRGQAGRVDDGEVAQVVAGERDVNVCDLVPGDAQPLRDHAGLVEGQAAAGAVAAHDVDPVGRAVAELRDDAGALADLGRRDPPPDQRVDQGGFAGFEASGDRDPQGLAEPPPHVQDLRTGGVAQPVADLLAEIGDSGTQRAGTHRFSAQPSDG